MNTATLGKLQTNIQKVEAMIAKFRQFNKKVELDPRLKSKKEELARMETSFQNRVKQPGK